MIELMIHPYQPEDQESLFRIGAGPQILTNPFFFIRRDWRISIIAMPAF